MRNIFTSSLPVLSICFGSAVSAVYADEGAFKTVSPLDLVGTVELSGESFISNPEAPPFYCGDQDFDDLAEGERLNQMFQSVVSITSAVNKGIGAGFILDRDQGYIVTNHHVVDDIDVYTTHLYDPSMINSVGRGLETKIIGTDEETDLAVLKVDPEHLESCVQISNQSVSYNDTVVGIGHPFGREFSLTQGVVSHPNRYSGLRSFIQSDSSINRGNSGGPLFNQFGNVVGVNSIIVAAGGGSNGVSLSIPIDRAISVAEDLILYGEVRKPWLGIDTRDVTFGERDALGLDNGAVYITGTKYNSPTAQAGIVENDILISVNNVKITNNLVFFSQIEAGDPGDSFEVRYLRDGEERMAVIQSESHGEYLARVEGVTPHSQNLTTLAASAPAPPN